jgi:hypothetical protein
MPTKKNPPGNLFQEPDSTLLSLHKLETKKLIPQVTSSKSPIPPFSLFTNLKQKNEFHR